MNRYLIYTTINCMDVSMTLKGLLNPNGVCFEANPVVAAAMVWLVIVQK